MKCCLSWNGVFVILAVGREVRGRGKIVKWILYSNVGLTEVFQTFQRNVSPSQEGLFQLLGNLKAVSQAHLRLLLFCSPGYTVVLCSLSIFSYFKGVSRSVVTLILSCTELPEEYSAPRVLKDVWHVGVLFYYSSFLYSSFFII